MDEQPEQLVFTVDDESIGQRLDKAVTFYLDSEFSRTEVQQWIKDTRILVNQTPSKAAYKLEVGDEVTISLPDQAPFELTAEPDIPVHIIHEDDTFVVVNKPAGIVVHPGHGNEHGTLLNGLLARYPEIFSVGLDETRAGIVHRIDKDVSGVLVVARTQSTFDHLVMQFQQRTVEKHYLALVEQHPVNDKGVIDAPIGRDPKHRKRMAVHRDGKPSVTEFYTRDYFGDHALLDVFPHTGRTHQIRVHLSFINCPIVGDNVYGFRKQRIKMKRIFLHAHKLQFQHPDTGISVQFESDLPSGLQDILNKLSHST